MSLKRRLPLTLVGLATRIGTVLAVSVYTDSRGAGSRQWCCWFDDESLRIVYPHDPSHPRRLPKGYSSTMDAAQKQFVKQLRGAVIGRDGRELTDAGHEWRVPKNLSA